MGTSKYVAVSLIVAWAGILAAGQDQSATSSQTASQTPSNTRFASCLVRIAVDPAIMPLSPGTVSNLIHSPAVLLKAEREVLSLSTPEDFDRLNQPQDSGRSLIVIGWLSASSASLPLGGRSLGQGDDARAYEETMRGGPAPQGQEKATVAPQRLPGETDASYRPRVAQARQEQLRAQLKKAEAGQKIGGLGGMGGFSGVVDFYQAPGAMAPSSGVEPSATMELQVNLPETVPPRADEFLKGVVKNLQDSLMRAFLSYRRDLDEALNEAVGLHRNMQSNVDVVGQGAVQLKLRLQQKVVDLSQLKRQTPLEEAIEVLKKSVEPPLNLVVLWKDLSEMEIQPTSPINVDGLAKVRLATLLDLLVKELGPGGGARPAWRIQDDTIVIGAPALLGRSEGVGGQPTVETDAVNLGGQRSELVRKRQTLELDLAGLDARQKAIQEQIAMAQEESRKQPQNDKVEQELQRLLSISEHSLSQIQQSVNAGRASSVELAEAEKSVAQARIDLAHRAEERRKQAGGGQLEEFTKELSRLVIDKAEKEAQLQIVHKQLDEVQRQLAQALTFDPETARLRLAQESLNVVGRRVTELQIRLANLQLPTVTMIGAN